jgi:hypothetical protein
MYVQNERRALIACGYMKWENPRFSMEEWISTGSSKARIEGETIVLCSLIEKWPRRSPKQGTIHANDVVMSLRAAPGKHQLNHGEPTRPQREPGGETVPQMVEPDIASR